VLSRWGLVGWRRLWPRLVGWRRLVLLPARARLALTRPSRLHPRRWTDDRRRTGSGSRTADGLCRAGLFTTGLRRLTPPSGTGGSAGGRRRRAAGFSPRAGFCARPAITGFRYATCADASVLWRSVAYDGCPTLGAGCARRALLRGRPSGTFVHASRRSGPATGASRSRATRRAPFSWSLTGCSGASRSGASRSGRPGADAAL